MDKKIKEFKIIEHFINSALGYPIECGIYEINTLNGHYFVVQTANDYKAISHSNDGTNLLMLKEEIIEEIKEILKDD